MAARSWVASANGGATDFPLENLPYGVFSVNGEAPRCGVAIGDFVLDVAALEAAGVIALAGGPLLGEGRWNPVMAAAPAVWAALRARLTALLADGAAERAVVEPHLVPLADVALRLPFRVSEYTDFYAGKHHAVNVGTMYRGAENALPANWLSIPIGYNGRASSVVVSGTDVVRPWGQVKGPDEALPRFARAARFDLELEFGAIVGRPSAGMVSVADADAMIFGYVLLNDWSARDIQTWEYQPLGPFQAKATATTISPWIVTKAALSRSGSRHRRGNGRSCPICASRVRWVTMSRSRSGWRPRAGGRPSSAGRTCASSTIRRRSNSPITPVAAARCRQATCSDRGRSPDRRRATGGACSSCRGTARSPSPSTTAAPAPSSRTATG